MKKIMISMAFAATLFVSCHNENLETSSPANSGIVTNNGSMYKISELPLVPEFAKPIEKEGEVRKFILIKNDGTKLNFELKSINSTLFGKMRTLIGSVNTGDENQNRAIMIVGENGFDLFYKDKNQDFRLKGKNELNIGYKKIEFNPQGKQKSEFLAFAQKKGINGQQLLNQVNEKMINDNSLYNVTIENSNHYILLNETATVQKRGSIESHRKCNTDLHSNPAINKISNMTASKQGRPYEVQTYNLQLVKMYGNADIDGQYAQLVNTLYNVDARFTVNLTQYQLTNSIRNPDDTFNEAYVEELAELANATSKVATSGAQMTKLSNWSVSHPFTGSGRFVRFVLYADAWEDHAGQAYLNFYRDSDNSNPYIHGNSILVACDDYSTVLTHECGHNMGAEHVDLADDVMYPNANFLGKLHTNPDNIRKVQTSLYKYTD
ncbi:matrixin family metalloprotease [Chryseobacterium sp. S0630]|uniref:zinc-dependent metalloprotease family protein n=1 Tax=Chryseobacterium sp. S0630 TaxID=2957803 RepID=UPI00209F5E0E|nr:zinc-dependent metalloprotease family protein [Chryseobacterium sp. S0630]MCP1299626.1 matrixin family metalloprotease [Chryseobacterium sp. S0630]